MVTQLNLQAVQNLSLEGYSEDIVEIDRTLIEQKRCPKKCSRRLIYLGLSNAVTYLAIGVCEPCGFAKVFWSNSEKTATAKRRFSKAKN